jgi:hypothetical protein
MDQPMSDLARRSEQLYASQLRAKLEPEHLHKFVAIEPDSGDYFLGETLSQAIQAVRRAYPDRLSFAMRVGHSTTCTWEYSRRDWRS